MCPASAGPSSERTPVITLHTPPGRSLVARHSANTMAVRGSRSDAATITALPLTSGGSTAVTRPSSAGSSGAMTPIDAGRLVGGEVEVRPGDGIAGRGQHHVLVGPAGVPDGAVDRGLDFALRGCGADGSAEHELLGQARRAGLHHLGQAVEHEAAVGRRLAGPFLVRRAGGDHGVADVLARAAHDVLAADVVGPARFAPHERAIQVEFVGFPDGHTFAHDSQGVRHGFRLPP